MNPLMKLLPSLGLLPCSCHLLRRRASQRHQAMRLPRLNKERWNAGRN